MLLCAPSMSEHVGSTKNKLSFGITCLSCLTLIGRRFFCEPNSTLPYLCAYALKRTSPVLMALIGVLLLEQCAHPSVRTAHLLSTALLFSIHDSNTSSERYCFSSLPHGWTTTFRPATTTLSSVFAPVICSCLQSYQLASRRLVEPRKESSCTSKSRHRLSHQHRERSV